MIDRYEYTTVATNSTIDWRSTLDELGSHGWELVSVDNNIAYLMRKVLKVL